ncbi:ferrichrome ABC transporter permease [Myxococcus stipitatus]|uniref:ferrichrome ABC transporter permease n=1 Tax=Myxococcus stipitatus TaxID=83455 RepID=UPI001F310EBF|nr:ferrichrome ABC transporter permease [Myxococcus stipitatus]MCE9670583.1 ferrichrome ABC transporter permease [Myxococcus stipitatus]
MLRYALAIFTSAFLLFGIQPLAGRYALPWYGGTPGVWTACMLFFQAALLGGYAYAHGLASRLTPRSQARVHLGLLAVAVAVVAARALWVGSPVAPGPEWRPASAELAVPRLLVMLAVTIGLPFFVLSTTGPLLQSWFARARPGRSPYALYALSNTGSLLALLGYPFLVEPWVGRAAQSWGFGVGFALFAVACAVCAVDVLKLEREAAATSGGETRLAHLSPDAAADARHEPDLLAEARVRATGTEAPAGEALATSRSSGAEVASPGAEVESPGAVGDALAASARLSGAKVESPVAAGDALTESARLSGAKVESPVAAGEALTASARLSGAEVKSPGVEVESPVAKVESPVAKVEAPSASASTEGHLSGQATDGAPDATALQREAFEAMRREARGGAPREVAPVDPEARPGLRATLTWLGLSTCASVLLLATTNQLSQDVAAGPFLWVLPLAVYLLTFIIAFSRESFYSRVVYSVLLIGSGAAVAHAHAAGPHFPLPLQLLAYAASLFAGCMVCHGELYRLRPAPRHLSAFYLWVSAGGVLGALFVSGVATAFFRAYWEYPLSLGGCCAVALAGMAQGGKAETWSQRGRRVLRGAMLVMVTVNLFASVNRELDLALFSARNFFGVVRVTEQNAGKPQSHLFSLRHGAITHGWQYVMPELRARPTTYFTRESGLGLAIAEQRRLRAAVGLPPGLRVGVLGLGVGTSAALLEAGDQGRFYEINPAVISLARGEGGFFSYLGDSPGTVEVVEGDARISLERELERGEPGNFDVLALDVFSSDAVPVHLLTAEAVALYKKHLAPHGVLALHISNVHLDLVPVTLAHARMLGMHAAYVFHDTQGDALRSNWMLLSPDREFSWGPTFTRATARVRRLGLRGEPDFVWTDDRSSVLHVLRRGGPDMSVMDVEAPSGPARPAPVAAPAPP